MTAYVVCAYYENKIHHIHSVCFTRDEAKTRRAMLRKYDFEYEYNYETAPITGDISILCDDKEDDDD